LSERPFSGAFKGNKLGWRNIFGAAAGLFAEKGYHQTTVDEIAQAIGVAKGTIYYHFKNKEELYLALLREGTGLFKKCLAGAAAGPGGPAARVERLISEQLLFFERERDLVFLIMKEFCGEGERRRQLAEMLAGCLKVMEGVIEEGVKSGGFKAVDAAAAARALFGMTVVTALSHLIQGRPIDHGQVTGQLRDVFLGGLSR